MAGVGGARAFIKAKMNSSDATLDDPEMNVLLGPC